MTTKGARATPEYRLHCEGGVTSWPHAIDSPWHWAATRFAVDWGGTRDDVWGFMVDLDQDGVEELGITSLAAHGNAGGTYAFFARRDTAWLFLGYLALARLQVLAPAGDGAPRVRTFGRVDVNCESAQTFTHDGAMFRQTSQRSSCEDGARFEQERGEAAVINPARRRMRAPFAEAAP